MQSELELINSEIKKNIDNLMEVYKTYLREDLPFLLVQWGHMSQLMMDVCRHITRNPEKITTIFQCYQEKSQSLLDYHIHYFSNLAQDKKCPLNFKTEQGDARFKAPEWEQQYIYKVIKDFYLLYSDFSKDVLDCIDSFEGKIYDQFALYVRNYIDAISPSNFLITNPELLRITTEQGILNLLKGFKLFLEDLNQNNGHFNVRMTDRFQFKIGKNIARTPGDVIFRNEIMELIQYRPQTKQVYEVPLLIIPPFINKYYILDLTQQKSFVDWIVKQGFTVFLISWVNADEQLRHKRFDDYVLDGPAEALRIIMDKYLPPKVNVLGYCVGGTVTACFLSFLKKIRHDCINSVTYLTTMLDFEEPGELGVFIDERQLDTLDKLMKMKGYLDGRLLTSAFNLLRPNDLIWPYFINNYLKGELPAPFDLLYWNCDSTHQPAEMYSYYLRQMYLHNNLKKGEVKVGGRRVELEDIDIPIFYLSCVNDHITPWESTYRGAALQPGSKTFVLTGAGHVAGVINPPEKNKYSYWINKNFPENPKDWLKGAKETKGSWWPFWSDWLRQYSGDEIDAKKIKIKEALCDAPGTYVKKTMI